MKKLVFILSMLIGYAYGQVCAAGDTVSANTVSLITYNSARVNGTLFEWTIAVTGLQLRYVRVGQTDTATASGSFSSALRNLTGLQANTQYRYYYRTICGSGTKNQTGVYTFTTLANTVTYTPMDAMGYQYKYVKVDSGLMVPRRDTTIGRAPNYGGSIVFKTSDSLFYGYNGLLWKPLAIDSFGIVNALNHKVDSVTVNSDSLFYWINGTSYGYVLPALANNWKTTGNSSTVAGTNYIGTNDAVALWLNTNGYNRLIIPAGGIASSTSSTDSVLVTKTDGVTLGKIAKTALHPTWQQTLTAGSTLTTTNTIGLGTNDLFFDGSFIDAYIRGNVSDAFYIEGNYNGSPRFKVRNLSAAGGAAATFQALNDIDDQMVMQSTSSGFTTGGALPRVGLLHSNAAGGLQIAAARVNTGLYFGVGLGGTTLAASANVATVPGNTGNWIFETGTFTPTDNGRKVQVTGTASISDTLFNIGNKYNNTSTALTMSVYDTLTGGYFHQPITTGTVTSISTGLGLSGGTITTSGTLLVDTASASIISRQRAAATYLPLAGATYTTTTGTGLDLTSSTVTTGNLMKLTNTGTAAGSNTKNVLAIVSSGANGTASQTVTGQTISVTNTGTTNTNVGLNVTASGATNNYAALFTGSVGIGTSTPATKLDVNGSSTFRGAQYVNVNVIADADYTVSSTDYIISCKNWTTDHTITLPDPATNTGKVLMFTNAGAGRYSFSRDITQIDNVVITATTNLAAGFQVVSDGTVWQITLTGTVL